MDSGLPFSLSVGAIAFLLGVIWGGPFIEVLKILKVGKLIQVELSPAHQRKIGTPTMGGLMIVFTTISLTLTINMVRIVSSGHGASVMLPLFVMGGYAFLGYIDDRAGIRQSTAEVGQGLNKRLKFIGQFILALITAVLISQYDGGFDFANEINFPLIHVSLPVSPWLFIPIVVFIIVATSNAVNFTDGLDGLAGIITATAFGAFGVIAYLQQQIFLTQLCFILVGACFAFLWYNAHPAQLFMGDTGSLALGAVLGTVAVMTGKWLLLPIIAIVPVAETVSVILQIASAQFTQRFWGSQNERRLFRQAPLHNHFELGGWSETQIVQRFWLVGILSALIGVSLALL
ncbi:MAG: phospho-N-acetylmuramoyl-pentapeptide-transferase [Chloroflexi bacterium]|nr:phospho-N-acetylmuramoyl-pentapeptide-transferase [Chloroflexota bacterium]